MGFNPLEEIGKAANGAAQAAGEAAKAVADGAGAAAKAISDGANAAAKAMGEGAEQAVKVVSDGASGAAKGVADAAAAGVNQLSNSLRGPVEQDAEHDNDENLETEVDEETAGKILDTLYEKALDGIPKVSRSVDEMVSDYASKTNSPEEAALALAKWQVMKCGTSGFLTGLGGLITLPVAIPANIGSVTYVQMRMIACIAKLGGYDLKSDQVQTMVYMCLTGTSASDVVKQAGIKTGTKALEAAIKKIPGQALTKINQKMGFRFITKFGEKGIINLGKMVPLVGGVIGGGVDVASTAVIAKNAIEMFIRGEVPDDSAPTEDEIIEVRQIETDDDSALI